MRDTNAAPVPIAARARAGESRDPAHALYDRALDLHRASRRLSAASATPGSVAAVPPALECVEASLADLTRAVEAMRREAERVVPRAAQPGRQPYAGEAASDPLTGATDAMRAARHSVTTARAALGPVICERLSVRGRGKGA
jgi:hypothetical protein